MNKVRLWIMATALMVSLAAGCGKKEEVKVSETKKIQVTEEKTKEETKTTKLESETTQKVTEEATQAETETEKMTESIKEQETLGAIPQKKEENVQKIEGTANEKIQMAFAGDIFFSDMLYENYVKGQGVTGFLSPKIAEIFKNADIFVANHEYVCSDNDTNKAEYQIYNFIAPTGYEHIWSEMGTDIVTLANNHALDYGQNALLDTMELLDELKIDYVGAGRSLDEALIPSVKEINGHTVAVFAGTRVVPQTSWYAGKNYLGLMTLYESTDRYSMMLEAVKEAKEKYDTVIVYTHMGVEKTDVLEEYQKQIAHGIADAGADLVVSSHPHVLQGMEYYNGKPIVYSMSNFLFGSYKTDTMVLNVTVNDDGTCSLNILPCVSSLYKVAEATGEQAQNIINYIESISVNVDIDEQGNVSEKK